MKRVLVVALAIWVGALAGTAAAENQTYMAGPLDWNRYKNMAVSFEWNFHLYDDTAFFDFWGLDSELSNRLASGSVGYELKLPNYFALEVAGGYSRFNDESSGYPQENDSVALDMDTISVQFSVKRYGPVTDLVSLFGGIGADLAYVDATLDYTGGQSAYRQESARTMYGGHALVGVEYRAGRRTSPFSVDLSLKYTVLEPDILDRELIDTINSNEHTEFSSRELDLSGFTLSTGIKFHF